MNERDLLRKHYLSRIMSEGRKGWEIEWHEWAVHLSKMIQIGIWTAWNPSISDKLLQVNTYWIDAEIPPDVLKISARIALEENMELIENMHEHQSD